MLHVSATEKLQITVHSDDSSCRQRTYAPEIQMKSFVFAYTARFRAERVSCRVRRAIQNYRPSGRFQTTLCAQSSPLFPKRQLLLIYVPIHPVPRCCCAVDGTRVSSVRASWAKEVFPLPGPAYAYILVERAAAWLRFGASLDCFRYCYGAADSRWGGSAASLKLAPVGAEALL